MRAERRPSPHGAEQRTRPVQEAHEIKHSTLVLGSWRAAQRIEFEIGQGPNRLLVYVVRTGSGVGWVAFIGVGWGGWGVRVRTGPLS